VTRAPSYSFRSSWLVPAEQDQVLALLADVAKYPQWWPQVRSVDLVEDGVADLVCRSLLPYRLRFRMRQRRRDPEAGVLEAALEGDLVGWCRWTLTRADGEALGTRVVFEQEVTTPGRPLRAVPRALQPVLALNHAVMMRGARRGLAGACSPGRRGRRRTPPPPRPRE
jgi:ribosome-associated toxin RatA of RatAB toxin-antitoxin module